MTEAIVCGPPADIVRRRVAACTSPVCKGARRRIVQRHMGVWYPTTFTCCTCGDSWAEGEYLERPFRRGWREKSARQARKDWDAALSPEWWAVYIRGDVDEEIFWARIFGADERDRWGAGTKPVARLVVPPRASPLEGILD